MVAQFTDAYMRHQISFMAIAIIFFYQISINLCFMDWYQSLWFLILAMEMDMLTMNTFIMISDFRFGKGSADNTYLHCDFWF